MKETELKIKNIDEAIANAMERYESCKEYDFKCLASYYGGYIEALQDIKNGNVKLGATDERN